MVKGRTRPGCDLIQVSTPAPALFRALFALLFPLFPALISFLAPFLCRAPFLVRLPPPYQLPQLARDRRMEVQRAERRRPVLVDPQTHFQLRFPAPKRPICSPAPPAPSPRSGAVRIPLQSRRNRTRKSSRFVAEIRKLFEHAFSRQNTTFLWRGGEGGGGRREGRGRIRKGDALEGRPRRTRWTRKGKEGTETRQGGSELEGKGIGFGKGAFSLEGALGRRSAKVLAQRARESREFSIEHVSLSLSPSLCLSLSLSRTLSLSLVPSLALPLLFCSF